MRLENGETVSFGLFVRALRHCKVNEPRHAVADKSSDLVRCALGKAESAQGKIRAVPKIVECVQQSSVKVKYNIIVFHVITPGFLLFFCRILIISQISRMSM